MANLEIHKNLFGGLSGTIDVSPGLSWADRDMLERVARGTLDAAREVASLRATVEQVGGAVAGSIFESLVLLERELGLRLDAQSAKLDAQLDVLERIDHTLRRPGQTRAAERIANTGELLRRGRYERARADAELAIEDDPNNPAGFVAAGWAAIGLGRTAEARQHFTEAAEACDGDARAEALRQAARLAFVLEDTTAALRLLDAADDQVSDFARRALAYDRSVYLAEHGEGARAERQLATALEGEQFALLALADPLLCRHERLKALATASLQRRVQALGTRRRAILERLDAARSTLESYDGPTPAGAAGSREDLRRQLADAQEALRTAFARGGRQLDATHRDLTELDDHAVALEAAAAAWHMAAEASFREQAVEETRRRQATMLRAAASELAGQKSAIPMIRRDGTWVVTRQRTFGRSRAWHVWMDGDQAAVSEIPWDERNR